MQHILWFEIAFKGGLGMLLFLAPLTAARLAGLQRPETSFWPRVSGALILGLAAGVFIRLNAPAVEGSLGPGGLVAINLAGASGLFTSLILGSSAPTRRGRVVILLTTLLLLTLAFAEIAHI